MSEFDLEDDGTDEFYEDDDHSHIFDTFEYKVDDIAESNHFNHLKSEDLCSRDSIDLQRRSKIEDILKAETNFEADLRHSVVKSGPEMLSRQEADLQNAFQEVNYLRAELAELVPNSQIPLYKKGIIAKYVTTNRKELMARRVYADTVRAAALEDARLGKANEEWIHRVGTDIEMMKEFRRIRSNQGAACDVVLRKKHAYDCNRAAAIFKADLMALTAAWPGGDYSYLASQSV